jgi:FHS family L-fucose permease-like MFS transporter
LHLFFNSYKTDLSNASAEALHQVETYRMKWLFGALAVVVVGLLASYLFAKKNLKVGEQ